MNDQAPPSVEERVATLTTVELLEEVDRRLADILFGDHLKPTSINPDLDTQVKFHFLSTLHHVRDATHNYNRARAYQNDRQKTSDFDKQGREQ